MPAIYIFICKKKNVIISLIRIREYGVVLIGSAVRFRLVEVI